VEFPIRSGDAPAKPIIVLGALGFLTNYATQKLEDRLLCWR